MAPMKTVRLTMSEEAYNVLRLKAAKAKYPGISSFVLSTFDLSNDDSVAVDIVKKAIFRARRQPVGESFTVRALFEKGEWNEYAVAARIKAGRLFQDKINDGCRGIEYKGKNGANHHVYIRVDDTDADGSFAL